MKLKKTYILPVLIICTISLLSGCKRNVINPNGEGCRKIEGTIIPGYPLAMRPAANWSTGKFSVSVRLTEVDRWQLRAYEADMSTFNLLDEAPIEHVSAWSKRNWIAYYDWDDGGVYRIKPDGTFKKRISSSPETPSLLWHPEEDILLVGSADFLWRVDLDGNLIGDTLKLSDPEIPLARTFVPLHWLDPDRIYGGGQGRSNIVFYSLGNQEVMEIYTINDEPDPSYRPIDFSSLSENLLAFSSGQGVFIFNLSSEKIEKRLLKGCENQRPVRLSAYDSQHLYMEVTLVDREGNSRRRVFRKNINKNSEEELEIF